MKREQFSMENITILQNGEKIFHHFTLHIYEGDCCGIICDSIEERNSMIELFEGNCEIPAGKIRYRNGEIRNQNSGDLFRKKCSVIQKKSKLIDSLSITENICIFADKSRWVYSLSYLEKTKKYKEQFQLNLDLLKPVKKLTKKERVLVELLKAYAERKELIVLTDLSTFLQNAELDEIHEMIGKFREKHITVLLIEAFSDLIFQWTNKILVVKNRTDFGCFSPTFLQKQKLYAFLSKRIQETPLLPIKEVEINDEILSLEGVISPYLSNVDFSVGTGEVLKILCLDMESVEGLRRIFCGQEKRYEGGIFLEKQKIRIQNEQDMRRKKIGYCKVKAYKSMLLPNMSVRDNIMLDLSIKEPKIWFWNKYRKSVDSYIERWLGREYAGKKVRDLSVFARQQLAFFKLYLFSPKVLVCEHPFFEADLHMREITMKMIEDCRDRGIAVIILLMSLQHVNLIDGDVLYMRQGKLIDEDEAYQQIYNA